MTRLAVHTGGHPRNSYREPSGRTPGVFLRSGNEPAGLRVAPGSAYQSATRDIGRKQPSAAGTPAMQTPSGLGQSRWAPQVMTGLG